MRLQIRPSALADLAKGRRFYDSQELGIGYYFFDSLFADIDSLQLYSGIHPKVMGYFRMLAKRFPYAIYYEVVEDVIIVSRILDLRQNPKSIKEQLKQ
ncbi:MULTISPECIES: type II toxin-antitoxin system RelE/ParE family toxin [unclassified Lentimonas]|uniref:type II toxin-antitoxin system RelE/ParE family toxin n=1 Tax=unclassified Lentimonas TaxID=2630993 RepID=UPI001324AF74|nr:MULTISPECIES: type II toxin-antitoxin system RelE/ParE family toxin [unclassified Lentimonas]CAA6690362.1 Unannotated [Lentimonas sp. CC19]CAA6693933.1 Unannotated [Lentimonas sp. CC10]CAA7068578.1 Unannotated [Lentimonas sp. CC11]